MKEIVVIDYKCGGNIFSVINSLESLENTKVIFSSEADVIKNASRVLFPGVGSFEAAISQLTELRLIDVIRDKALSGIPFMGICVGMQVLFSSGTEGSGSQGLAIFAGSIDKFESQELKVPHMGWNSVSFSDSNPLFKDINNPSDFYFVHSYRLALEDSMIQANKKKFPNLDYATTNYAGDFVSHIWNGDNLFACQFHPEKSGEAGLQILSNFIEL